MIKNNFSFKVTAKDKSARTGVLKTTHGEFKTPAFMPCGTLASVKSLTPQDVREAGGEIVLANAYHLYLRPGTAVIKKAGGLHKFMGWRGPILTDSGGFQVFSLGNKKQETRNMKQGGLVKVTDKGVEFRSHIDGSKHFFTPEAVMQIQAALGSDIIMPLDECAPGDADYASAKRAMFRTHNWLLRSLALSSKLQALFGIIQGVIYDDLRTESTKFIASQDVSGVAIGGLSVGEKREDMYHILEVIHPHLPEAKPRHLLGVGEPLDILESVERGIDMFDCVIPTRLARHGAALTAKGRINLLNKTFKSIQKPIEENCQCYACRNFSLSYVSHLLRENEILGIRLLTIHNLHFMFNFMAQIRAAISTQKFGQFKRSFAMIFANNNNL